MGIVLDFIVTEFSRTGTFPVVVVDFALGVHYECEDDGKHIRWVPSTKYVAGYRQLREHAQSDPEKDRPRLYLPIQLFKYEYEMFVAKSALKELSV